MTKAILVYEVKGLGPKVEYFENETDCQKVVQQLNKFNKGYPENDPFFIGIMWNKYNQEDK